MKQHVVLILCGLLLAGILSEAGFRIYNGYIQSLPESQPGAYLYQWNTNPFLQLPNGAVTGKPNTPAHLTCTLADATVFDTPMHTNNLGLFDTRQYHKDPAARKRIALVGDSYTQGIGSIPWIPDLAVRLEKDFPVQLFGLGITGTGFENFDLLLEHYEQELSFTDIIILAIEDDFARMRWYPLASEGFFWFCPISLTPEACVQTLTFQRVLDHKDSPGAPPPPARFHQAAHSYQRFPARTWYTRLLRPLIAQSALLNFLNARRHDYLAYRRKKSGTYLSPRFPENLAALQSIISRYGKARVTLVRFPAKYEVEHGFYEYDSRQKLEPLVGKYIDLWEHCSFTIDMYHSRDHHFHAEGYAAFSHCFEQHVLKAVLNEALLQTVTQ